MYTQKEIERYTKKLNLLGVTDESKVRSVLDFVYTYATIVADEIAREHYEKEKE